MSNSCMVSSLGSVWSEHSVWILAGVLGLKTDWNFLFRICAFCVGLVSSLLVSGFRKEAMPIESCLLCLMKVQKRLLCFFVWATLAVWGRDCWAYDIFHICPVFPTEALLDFTLYVLQFWDVCIAAITLHFGMEFFVLFEKSFQFSGDPWVVVFFNGVSMRDILFYAFLEPGYEPLPEGVSRACFGFLR